MMSFFLFFFSFDFRDRDKKIKTLVTIGKNAFYFPYKHAERKIKKEIIKLMKKIPVFSLKMEIFSWTKISNIYFEMK